MLRGRWLDEHAPRVLLAAVIAGFVLRAAWALLVPVVPVSDSVMYHEFAKSLANGRGFAFPDGTLTAWWPVGTSAAYAVLYKLFGEGPASIVAFQVLIGVGVVWLTGSLAAHYFGRTTGALAAWFTACWPLLIQFTTILASELLFVFLLLAALRIWCAHGLPWLPRTLAWAVVLTGAIYVRPQAQPLLLLLPLLDAWRLRSVKGLLPAVAAACITAGLLLAPWALRNKHTVGGAALVSTNFGTNVWMGNNPASNGGYMPLPDLPFANEVERNRYFGQQALTFIRDNPLTFLKLCIRRFIMTHDRESIGVVWNEPGLRQALGGWVLMPLKAVSAFYWLALAAMAVAGAVVALRRGRLAWIHPMTLVPLMFVAIVVLTVGQDRYHIPVNPFVAMLAAFLLVQCRQRGSVVGQAIT